MTRAAPLETDDQRTPGASYILTAMNTTDRALLGGKAASLAALDVADLPIPPWFVVTPSAFAAPSGATMTNAVLPAALREALGPALRRICPDGRAVAVRSSTVEEDAAAHSFAGQLESWLDVDHADVPARIADVWRSGFTDRVRHYRQEHGLTGPPPAPAVLVQRMVKPHAAGVAFAADPVSGRRRQAVVAAVAGLGTSLVSGEADADTWHVDRDGTITQRQMNGASPLLEDDQVRAIATLARRASAHFGMPQDIEWAIEDGELFLLQARPITSLAGLADPDGLVTLWDNSNIVESYSGVTTPLTFSFARSAYEEVYRQFCRIMGVAPRVIESNAEVFRCMLGLIRGRVYYNLINWYRLLAMLPGFRANRAFMEQMMGVREALPADVVESMETATAGEKLRDVLRLARSLVGLVWAGWTLPRRIAHFQSRLDTALAEPDPPLSAQRADELAASYRALERQLLTKWDAPIVNDFFAMIFHGLLRKLSDKWCGGDEHDHLHNDLLCGEGGMISTEPARRLTEMAAIASGDEAIVELLVNGGTREILDALRTRAMLSTHYESYVTDFGDRCLEELKLESATLHDEPLPLLRGIGHLARRTPTVDPAAESIELTMRHEAERRVAAALSGRPLHRFVFNWVLRNARHRVRDRENLRFERTRVFGRVRRLFVEIGRRLQEVDRLDEARDVFYLEVEEILGFINGTTTTVDLRGLAALRRREYEAYEAEPPPDARFQTLGIVHEANDFRSAAAEATAESDDERRGLACCPGIVRGRVRVVHDPREVTLHSGEILVAPQTDPGWVMIFPAASGLLVERGSLLSHSAIVAREMGLPAIVSITGLTHWLQDGDEVEMDGSTGVVRRLAGGDGTGDD